MSDASWSYRGDPVTDRDRGRNTLDSPFLPPSNFLLWPPIGLTYPEEQRSLGNVVFGDTEPAKERE